MSILLQAIDAIQSIEDSEERYAHTVRVLMRSDIRESMAGVLCRYGLPNRPRDVLAMILVALNHTMVLDMREPNDMVCRHAAEQFLPLFYQALENGHDPSMCVEHVLVAFGVWKDGSRDDVRIFAEDVLVKYRLSGAEKPSRYWCAVHRDVGGDVAMADALFGGPIERRRPSQQSRPCNLSQLHHYVADSLVHPFLQQYVRRAGPNSPLTVDQGRPYLERLAAVVQVFSSTEVDPSMEGILAACQEEV